MIGISGLRGTIGATLSPEVVSRWCAAFAARLKRDEKPANGSHFVVAFGRDSRPSGTFVRDAAVSVLIASGIEVIDLDIVTTPTAALMVRHLGADAAVIATASHNPIQWNGIKLIDRRAIAPPPATVQSVIDLYHQNANSFVRVQELKAGRKSTEAHAIHVQRVLEQVDVLGISSCRFKVVLDSVNGAGCVPTHMLLSRLGCQIVHLNNTPDGQFPHEPEPTEKNLTQLAGEVKRQRAQVGFAQDPDADRLAVIDEFGTYIGEEYSLALCAKMVMAKKAGVVVVANLSTSRMIDDIAKQYGGSVLRSSVGEANVVDMMMAKGSTLGGEGNGGVIDPRVVPGRDSLLGMAYVLQLLASTKKSVSQLVGEIPRYTIIKDKFECPRADSERAVEALKLHFASEKVDLQDGIRIDWPDAWIHARASNTEPIMRIIAEAPSASAAQARVNDVRQIVDQTLGK